MLSLTEKIREKAVLHKDLPVEIIYFLCPHPTKHNCNKSWCRGDTDFCRKQMDVVLVSQVLAVVNTYGAELAELLKKIDDILTILTQQNTKLSILKDVEKWKKQLEKKVAELGAEAKK